MSTARKSRRARSSPPLPAPTENQLFEAMLAFNTLKMRYRLECLPHAPPIHRYIVRVLPVMIVNGEDLMDAAVRTMPTAAFRTDALEIHRFSSEDQARRWREHEIIRETIKVAMRTKP